MKLIIEKDYQAMSARTASMITDVIRKKPDALLCLAAGDTPRQAYGMMVKTIIAEKIDISSVRFVSLDEWVGVPPENEGSCQFFLRSTVFTPLNMPEEHIRLFDALAPDLDKECTRMDEYINRYGGIDLMVVGVGRNGHIGFNEPGTPFDLDCHVVELDDTTRTVGQKYFHQETILTRGITLGLNYLTEAGTAIMIANGPVKATVIKEAVEGEISTAMPASIMRRHPNAYLVVDEDAASLLSKEKTK